LISYDAQCDLSQEKAAFLDFAQDRVTDVGSTRHTGRIRVEIKLDTVGTF